jgi:ABC-2 type transport system ATP-binding protein
MLAHQAIDVRNLRKVFGDTVAVDDVSFQIGHGEIFGFMGHNGAGKTTTIRMLLGLLKPTRGGGWILGHDIVRESLSIRQVAGFLPDGYALPKEMTARRFLRYVGTMFGMTGDSLERQIETLLERFDLISRR